MEVFFFFLLVPLVICLAVANAVYRKQKKKGENPWGWTIVSFLITLGVMILGVYLFFNYVFVFER